MNGMLPNSPPEFPGGTRLKMPAKLSLETVADIQDQIMARLEESDAVSLDLAEVTECDLAGVQLLCAAYQSTMTREKELFFLNPGAAVKQAFQAAGVNATKILNL